MDGQIKPLTPISYTRTPQPHFFKKAQFRSKLLCGDPSLPPGRPRSPRGGGTATRGPATEGTQRGHSGDTAPLPAAPRPA